MGCGVPCVVCISLLLCVGPQLGGAFGLHLGLHLLLHATDVVMPCRAALCFKPNKNRYAGSRQVRSVATKLKKFHTVMQECGGIKMGLQVGRCLWGCWGRCCCERCIR